MAVPSSLDAIFLNKLAGLSGIRNTWLRGLAGSSPAFVVQSMLKRKQHSLFMVAADKEKAAYLFNDLEAINPGQKTLFFPESYRQPYVEERTTNANIQERAEVLNLLSSPGFHGIVVTYPGALCEMVTRKRHLSQHTLQVNKGEKLSVAFLSEFLNNYGFAQVDFVFQPGQFSIRGGIIDIYSFANEYPFRIELFGDQIESIRAFDPSSQLSTSAYNFITIIPNINSAVFTEEKALLLNYFAPENTLVFFDDAGLTLDVFDRKLEQATKSYAQLKGEVRQVEPAHLYASSGELRGELKLFRTIEYGARSLLSDDSLAFSQRPQPTFSKNFDMLIANLKENKSLGYRNFFLTDNSKQAHRLISIFNDLLSKEHRTYESLIEYVPLNIHEGFIDDEAKIAVYTDHQVFERYHRFRLRELKLRSAEALTMKELLALNPGDFVTHIDHGIGRFAGLEKITINGRGQESVKLLFKDNDALYVSIHSLHRISKYSGKEGQVPRIDKLGSTTWQTLKQRTKRKVKELAYDLIRLYAERKSKPGHAYPKDNYLQHELEASFIYEDTRDQVKVTKEVKQDMERPHPMDRLVCGDVGFGKTEIAIRAAFKAVCDNRQVAVLVPTTILAYQHFKTFSDRLKDFPCTVDYINRFRSTRQQKDILGRLSEGKLDIIIGTHKLAGKEVKFSDLGLLIIDEEQKFGVSVKDKLKTLKANVDTLTLTATPIPRTLQFSLMGARDLSVISTPPPNRFPVQTELSTFGEEVIRDAISHELSRGGQVFFVHNKINTITEVAGMIQRLVPDARVAIGHGQMEGHKLEEVMLGFMEGESDVLVSTTIIESGLDISNANTIIINDAHAFGLSDLHQMRGRVGRSNKKAFCYLLAPSSILLSDEARKRLKAIVEFSDLGSGFQIAMRDLDIRGAGNLLGGEQSGFINDMGFDTYMKILNEAVDELKEEAWYKEAVGKEGQGADKSVFSRQFVKDTVVDTDLQLLIPDAYVASLTERLLLYRELDNITEEEALTAFETNLRDRFGPVPTEVTELVNVVRMRWAAMKLGFEKITLKNGKMLGYFLSKKSSDYFSTPAFNAALRFAQEHPRLCALKEHKEKLILTVEDIRSVRRAIELLSQITAMLPKVEVKEK
jgi:transcription-repair coupling factor (superfamily II helicase)